MTRRLPGTEVLRFSDRAIIPAGAIPDAPLCLKAWSRHALAFAALSALAATGFSLARSVAARPHVPLMRVCSETCAPAATATQARPRELHDASGPYTTPESTKR